MTYLCLKLKKIVEKKQKIPLFAIANNKRYEV